MVPGDLEPSSSLLEAAAEKDRDLPQPPTEAEISRRRSMLRDQALHVEHSPAASEQVCDFLHDNAVQLGKLAISAHCR